MDDHSDLEFLGPHENKQWYSESFADDSVLQFYVILKQTIGQV